MEVIPDLGGYDDEKFEENLSNALKETDPTKRGSGMSMILVPADTPGVTRHKIPLIGWAGMALIIASGIASTILRSRALPNPPAEEH